MGCPRRASAPAAKIAPVASSSETPSAGISRTKATSAPSAGARPGRDDDAAALEQAVDGEGDADRQPGTDGAGLLQGSADEGAQLEGRHDHDVAPPGSEQGGRVPSEPEEGEEGQGARRDHEVQRDRCAADTEHAVHQGTAERREGHAGQEDPVVAGRPLRRTGLRGVRDGYAVLLRRPRRPRPRAPAGRSDRGRGPPRPARSAPRWPGRRRRGTPARRAGGRSRCGTR